MVKEYEFNMDLDDDNMYVSLDEENEYEIPEEQEQIFEKEDKNINEDITNIDEIGNC